MTARQQHHDQLDAIITEWTRQHDRYDIMEKLQSRGIAASPVLDGRDMHLDPHFKARGFLEKVEFPEERQIGTRHLMGPPYKFSATPLVHQGLLRQHFGHDNRWALGDLLGVPDTDIESLEQLGAIASAPQTGEASPTMPMDELGRPGPHVELGPRLQGQAGHPLMTPFP